MCKPTTVQVCNAAPGHVATSKKEKKKKESAPKKVPEGDDKVLAERFRTKKCRNFLEKGTCPYESRCMFAHGDHQLRTAEMNLRDGLVNEEAIRQFKRMLVFKAKAQAATARHIAQGLCPPFPGLMAFHLPRSPISSMSSGVGEESGSSSTPALSSSHSRVDSDDLDDYDCASMNSSLREYNSEGSYRYNPYGWTAISKPQTPVSAAP